MKSGIILLLVLAVVLNTHAQPAHHGDHLVVVDGDNPVVSSSSLQSYVVDPNGDADRLERRIANDHDMNDDEENEVEDPMLQSMLPFAPDFKAYVRADISSFYGLPPGSVAETKPAINAGQACKYINMSPETISMYSFYNEKLSMTRFGPWSSTGTTCYASNKFNFTKEGNPLEVLCSFSVVPGTSVYYCDPFEENDAEPDPGRGLPGNAWIKRSLNELSDADRTYYNTHVYNLEFGRYYKNFTGGSEWLAMYPPERPRHKIWRADHFGQEHIVVTPETHFEKMPPQELMHNLGISELARLSKQGWGGDDTLPLAEYRVPGGPMNLTIRAISCAPRAFEIKNFLSDFESDHLLDLVKQKGQRMTKLIRRTDPILNAIYQRAADVLGINEALFRRRMANEQAVDDTYSTSKEINEDLRFIHYDKGQDAPQHYDFRFPEGPKKGKRGNKGVHSINFCIYLNTVPEGGQTSFPRWRHAEASKSSLDVVPEKGKAMFFYMVNPDGNLDDLSLHAGLPVIEGEKYFSNLFINSF